MTLIDGRVGPGGISGPMDDLELVRKAMHEVLEDMEALRPHLGTSGGEPFQAAFDAARLHALVLAGKYAELVGFE